MPRCLTANNIFARLIIPVFMFQLVVKVIILILLHSLVLQFTVAVWLPGCTEILSNGCRRVLNLQWSESVLFRVKVQIVTLRWRIVFWLAVPCFFLCFYLHWLFCFIYGWPYIIYLLLNCPSITNLLRPKPNGNTENKGVSDFNYTYPKDN